MSVQLGRKGVRRLLGTVNNETHATEEDHADDNKYIRSRKGDGARDRRSGRTMAEKNIPTPPGSSGTIDSQNTWQGILDLTDDAIKADPKSDDDPVSDDTQTEDTKEMPKKSSARVESRRSAGNIASEVAVSDVRLSASPGSSTSNKRSGASDDPSDDWDCFKHADGPHMLKRPRIGTYSSSSMNIHAPSRAIPTTYQKPAITYGRSSQQKKKKRSSGFKTPSIGTLQLQSSLQKKDEHKPSSGPAIDNKARPRFVMRSLDRAIGAPELVDMDTEPMTLSDDETSTEPVETKSYDKVDTRSNDPSIECAFCGERVDRFMKEEYEDTYNQGKELSFKWQRRFCEYHRKQHARNVWQERKYPNIDWSGLTGRMRKHDALLLDVLHGEESSYHRDALREKLKPRKRDLHQAIGAEDCGRPGAFVGYYGPKGEKMMADHIITSMSGEIRRRATKDKLVASTGVQGGVTGFIQSVLVPHLAELLIKEDMNISGKDWSIQARNIIAESAEIGELMSPEAEDHIVPDEDEADSH